MIGLTTQESICLPKMLMLYEDRSATKAIKNEIVKKIFDLAMALHYNGEEINHEAIILGIGMMFEDHLDWDDTNSLIHIIGNSVTSIVENEEIV